MTRDEVLDAVYDEVTAKDTCVEDAVVSLLEEIVRLRGERDAMEGMSRHHAAVALDAIEKLNSAERILAALREPSEAVGKAAADEMYGIDVDGVSSGAEAMYRSAAIRVIRAAVAAAEQEATS